MRMLICNAWANGSLLCLGSLIKRTWLNQAGAAQIPKLQDKSIPDVKVGHPLDRLFETSFQVEGDTDVPSKACVINIRFHSFCLYDRLVATERV